MEQKTILLIDDEPDFLEIFGTKLGSLGYTILTAKTGEEGMQAAKNSHPNLILLDMDMPGLSGADVIDALKNDPETENIKVAFLTNLGGPEDMSKSVDEKISREIGAADYIKKTLNMDQIAEEVAKLLV